MYKTKTVYGRDSNKRIKEWRAEVELEEREVVIRVYYGISGKKISVSIRRIAQGKNRGRANETNPFEQAVSEINSQLERKKKEGYKTLLELDVDTSLTGEQLLEALNLRLPIYNTDKSGALKPMKAQPYYCKNVEQRMKHPYDPCPEEDITINFPCYIQPKLNGFRAIAHLIEEKTDDLFGIRKRVVFKGKKGDEYTDMSFIGNELIDLMDKEMPLDGELYIRGEILSEISSAVRKGNPKTHKVKFYIFDTCQLGVNQKDRLKCLVTMQKKAKILKHVIFVPSMVVESNEEAQVITDRFIKEGYEGSILRDPFSNYKPGLRPKTMVKLKRFQDKEFLIVDVVSYHRDPLLAIFVCEAENGKLFRVTPEGDREKREEYLKMREVLKGKLITVRFFERTKNGLPFHAVGVNILEN